MPTAPVAIDRALSGSLYDLPTILATHARPCLMGRVANSAPPAATVLIYDSYGGLHGHWAEYYAVLTEFLGMERTESFTSALISERPVLVASIESSLWRYAILSVVRAAMGRNTAGFLYRPLPTVSSGSARMRIKRHTLALLKRLSRVGTFTILPFEVDPRFATVASHWIYDIQFWDLYYPVPEERRLEEGPLSAAIRAAAGSKRICCAIGRQDRAKGLDKLASLYGERPDVRDSFLFVSAGEVMANARPAAQRLEESGGLVIDRALKRDELFDLYTCADLVWCSYAPDYDQASGIFGRALQLGVPMVVRDGSLIHRFCRAAGIAHLAYNGDPASFRSEDVPPHSDPEMAAGRARAYGEASVRQLRRALGQRQELAQG
jgi:hypothetical protein